MRRGELTPIAEGWTKPPANGPALHPTGFHAPSASQLRALPSEFPETAKVSGLVDAMVEIDERWAHLKAVRAAGYQTPPSHPDIQPANEAVILWEHYREAQRLPDAVRRGTDFIDRLQSTEAETKEAARLLRLFATEPRPTLREQLDKTFEALGKTCASCHQMHRDPAGGKASRF